MFTVAGRMIGHSFLHCGPSFPGLSPAIIHVLFGGSLETTPVTIRDCPDLDIRDTVKMVRKFGRGHHETWKIFIFSTKKLHLSLNAQTQLYKPAISLIYFVAPAWIIHIFDHVLFQLDGDTELKESDPIHQLCLSWNLPTPNATNRKWLSEKLLFHTVNVKVFFSLFFFFFFFSSHSNFFYTNAAHTEEPTIR